MDDLQIKEIEARVAVKRLLDRPSGAMELFEELLFDFKEREKALSKREGNLWVVVNSLKKEHLEEMKKIITSEVFESLNL